MMIKIKRENSEQKTKNWRRTGTRQRTGKEQTSQNEETILQLESGSKLIFGPN